MNDIAAPVVVTGASGHLGANLVRHLLAQKRRVRVLVRGEARALVGLAVEGAMGDVLDPASLERAFAGAQSVFHLAGKVSTGCDPAAEVHAVNVTGTKNVIEACVATGVGRLVHMSSIQALAAAEGEAEIDETSPLIAPTERSRGVYDHTKAEAERQVLAAAGRGLSAVVLNPTGILGPYDFQRSPMGQVLLALALGRMPALVAGADCDFVDVRDVAEAALQAEKRGPSGARYILSGTRLSLVDLARRWSDITGRPAPRFAVPMVLARLSAPFAPRLARLAGRRPLFTSESLSVLRNQPLASHRHTSAALGYQPRPIEETLRDTWAWMKTEAWL
jgi:dihydroflavonol-4-reductase